MSISTVTTDDLRQMNGKEGLVLQGCGGDPQEWLDGINGLLTDEGILKNGSKFENISVFQNGSLTNILFPFEDGVEIDMGKLAMWRLCSHEQFGGTWLSDYVPNRLGGFVPAPKGGLTYEELQQKTAEFYASGEVYTSPDFQCDQTGGFPTSLCVCWEKQKAWLELNENILMDRDGMELDYYRDLCADYGIRSCCDIEDFNSLLRGLGEDAIRTAELLPDEDESITMGGM